MKRCPDQTSRQPVYQNLVANLVFVSEIWIQFYVGRTSSTIIASYQGKKTPQKGVPCKFYNNPPSKQKSQHTLPPQKKGSSNPRSVVFSSNGVSSTKNFDRGAKQRRGAMLIALSKVANFGVCGAFESCQAIVEPSRIWGLLWNSCSNYGELVRKSPNFWGCGAPSTLPFMAYKWGVFHH